MYSIFIVLHVIISVVLCVVVLLQSSKGGGLAGAFGGAGAPQQIFGTRGMTTLLHKMTIYCAVGFFITSAVLFAMTAQRGQERASLIQQRAQSGELPGEAAPPAPTGGVQLPPLPEQGQAPAGGAGSGGQGGEQSGGQGGEQSGSQGGGSQQP
jgi:preprotein translocase subunit SecG